MILSASKVTGPLAASAITFALIFDAFVREITPSIVAGMRISQGNVKASCPFS